MWQVEVLSFFSFSFILSFVLLYKYIVVGKKTAIAAADYDNVYVMIVSVNSYT